MNKTAKGTSRPEGGRGRGSTKTRREKKRKEGTGRDKSLFTVHGELWRVTNTWLRPIQLAFLLVEPGSHLLGSSGTDTLLFKLLLLIIILIRFVHLIGFLELQPIAFLGFFPPSIDSFMYPLARFPYQLIGNSVPATWSAAPPSQHICIPVDF